MKPKLSIGMAVSNDFDGVYFSIQALKMYHSEVIDQCELIVVDNKPEVEGGQKMIQPLLGNAVHGTAGVKYVPMPSNSDDPHQDKTGTSQPRNAIFDNASGEFVLCMDSHVMIKAGALEKLLNFYKQNPLTKDLYSGPLLYDNIVSCETHFDDIWRQEMYGVWGRAWACSCYKDAIEKNEAPWMFTPREEPGTPMTEYWALEPTKRLVSKCERCGKELPSKLAIGSHYGVLEQAGHLPMDKASDDFPMFRIPAMGLGLFTCRREDWLEFNRHFQGFGGEEIYIHEKYRQAGRENYCLPFLRWLHRFGRSHGVPYRLIRYDKMRNYVLAFQELGRDLAPVHEHFVASGLVPIQEWEFLLEDPVKHIHAEAYKKFVGGGQPLAVASSEKQITNNPSGQPMPPSEFFDSADAMLSWYAAKPRDLNEHLPRLAELASQVNHVTEFSERRESTVGLFAGRPERLISYNTENDMTLVLLQQKYPWITVENKRSENVPQIEETGLLFLDSGHTAEKLMSELGAYAPFVKRWIVLHDTVVYGNRGPDGSDGMVVGMKQFLEENPDWFIYSHTPQQYGLTVLGVRPEDKPAQEVRAWALEKGPGTELKALLHKLGINPSPTCDCNAMAREMDNWGVEECKRRKEEIIARIHDNQARWGWKESIANLGRGSFKALTSGLAFKISWKEPLPSLLDLAIHNAEEKEKKEAARKALEAQKGGN